MPETHTVSSGSTDDRFVRQQSVGTLVDSTVVYMGGS